MSNDIIEPITEFLQANRHAQLIEAVVDTSVSRHRDKSTYSTAPYLNLYASSVSPGHDLKQVLKKVADTDDWGFLADITHEIDSTSYDISLETIYPRWPDDIDSGDKAIINMLMTSVKDLSPETLIIFYHIGAWPPVDLRTGQAVVV